MNSRNNSNVVKTGWQKFAGGAAIAALTLAAPATHAGGSQGVWLSGSISGALDTNKVFSIQFSEENRFGENHLDEVHATVGLNIKALDWLSLTPHYHSILTRKATTGTRWSHEDRTGIDITPSFELGGWKFADRNRIVWRNNEGKEGFWRYRNRLQVTSPWKWTDLKINPYTSFEIFLDDAPNVRKNDKFDQWRFIVGATAKISRNASLNVFYLLQDKKNTSEHEWSGNNILGVGLNFKF